MTTETETTGEDFAAFEARSLVGEPEQTETTEEKVEENPEVNDTLELEEGDELVEDDEGDKKSRSKPLRQRLGEVSEKRRIAEARAKAAEAELARLRAGGDPNKQPGSETIALPDKPNPEDFEFGDADPAYIDALTDWKVEAALAKRDEQAKAEAKQTEFKQAIEASDNNWKQMAEKAIEADPSFQEVLDSAAANEWPLMPHSAAAVAASENGAEIARYLNDNRDEATKLARAETAFHNALTMAKQAGLPEAAALAIAAPAYDRAVEIFEGIEAKAKGKAKPEPNRITNAPEPVRHSVRGAGGKFGTSADTTDFSAFEKMANGKK